MANSAEPTIADSEHLPELTLKVIVVAIVLVIVLAVANTYLALKIGILTSASIPAAVLSMGIFRCFRRANILENNLVQTAASAGEAVAGGIVYTIPALVIIGYWDHFSYWENLAIATVGGLFGVLFSIPLRRILMTDSKLRFPEGKAIASILQSQHAETQTFGDLLFGGMVGAILELGQTGFKVLAESWQYWMVKQRTIIGFGGGFSAAMIGAGYLIGVRMGISILFGAVTGWFFSVLFVSYFSHEVIKPGDVLLQLATLRQAKISYIGIGCLLFSGVWTLIKLSRPLCQNIQETRRHHGLVKHTSQLPRTEQDIPMRFIAWGTGLLTVALMILFYILLPLEWLHVSGGLHVLIYLYCVVLTLFLSAVFSGLTAYLSGMVGVSATPGSAFVIGGLLLSAVGLLAFLPEYSAMFGESQILALRAITIIMVSMMISACAISIDNMQDLKVGHLIGATPWRQQVMLMLGVVVAAMVIPPTMQVLYTVYGIAGVVPHAGMSLANTLPSPPAAVIATLSNAVFHHDLPYTMLGVGVLIMIGVLTMNKLLVRLNWELSLLGVSIGIYLPLNSSVPLFLGGLLAWLSTRKPFATKTERGTMVACGLVSGAAIVDVILAVPFSMSQSADVLRLVPLWWTPYAIGLSVLTTFLLGVWFSRLTR